MKIFIGCLIAALLPAIFAHAEQIEEALPFVGNPQAQWIVHVDGEKTTLLKAEVRKTPSLLIVTADDVEVSVGGLVGGVILLDNGKVISSALHMLGQNEVVGGSRHVGELKVSEMTERTQQLRAKAQKLEETLNQANTSLREKAGLGEVDRIYQKIESLNQQLAP